ncbi:hypothetical protein [Methylobacterium mesophilicum]
MASSRCAAEVAERAFRLKLAGVTEADVGDVATRKIRIPVFASELSSGLTRAYRALPEPELEPLLALDAMQGHRVKERMMLAAIACVRRGDDGVLEAMKHIMFILHDLREMVVLDPT